MTNCTTRRICHQLVARCPTAFAIMVFLLGSLVHGHAGLFTNSTPIVIPTLGVGQPYPSSITVTGMTTRIANVQIIINRLHHTYPRDLNLLLQGPEGQSMVLMSQAGGGLAVTNLTFTFDSQGFALPTDTRLGPFYYQPTNYAGSSLTFPSPGVAKPYGETFSVFKQTSPNGIWNLFVVDSSASDDGGIDGGWVLAITPGTGTPDPTMSVGDAIVTEGSNAVFPVTLSASTTNQVTVSYATQSGTATANNDYVPQNGTLIFPAGTTGQTITVPTIGDGLIEPDESFFVDLAYASGATLLRAKATGTILNDDLPDTGTAPSDNFAGAAPFNAMKITLSGSNSGATAEPSEPDHAGKVGGKSVWWSWTAPASGGVQLRTAGSDFDTLLAVYVGNSVDNLTPVASNDNDGTNFTSSIFFNAVSNTTYRVAVDGRDGGSGNISLSLLLNPGGFIISPNPRSDFWVPDGPVYSAVETNGIIYLGGNFDFLRPNRGRGLALDVDTHQPDLGFPTGIGPGEYYPAEVYAVLSDGAGGWFIGGAFTTFGGFPHTNLVHVLSGNTVDASWNPRTDNFVQALALDGHTLYVGGQFVTVNGIFHWLLAAVDTQTGEVATSDFGISLDYGEVHTLAVAGKKLYVGGYFRAIGGMQLSGLAAYDLNTRTLSSSQPSIIGIIEALAQTCDTLYVGGYFTVAAGQPRTSLAAFDLGSGAITPWHPILTRNPGNPEIKALAVGADAVYVGGDFSSVGGLTRSNLAAVTIATGNPIGFNPKPNGTISALVVANGDVYAGGDFSSIGGQPRIGFAELAGDSGVAIPWDFTSSGTVLGIGASGRRVYAGDAVLSSGGVPRRNLAALDAVTGLPTDWNPGGDDGVWKLINSGNRLFVLYSANNLNGAGPIHGVVALDLVTGSVDPWTSPIGFGDDMIITGDTLCVSDPFEVRAANLASGQMLWTNNLDFLYLGDRTPMCVSGDTLYVGGDFDSVNGQPALGLAAFDLLNGARKPWNPSPVYDNNNLYIYVDGLGVAAESIFASGFLVSLGGQPRTNCGAVDPLIGFAAPWVPELPIDQSDFTISVLDDSIYGFTAIGLRVFDPNTGRIKPEWQPAPGVSSPLLANGRTIFTQGASVPDEPDHPFFAVFAPEGAPAITIQPRGQTLPVGQTIMLSAHAAGQPPLGYQWQLDGTNIDGAVGDQLVLANAQFTNSGLYRLIVTNGLGYVRSVDTPVKIFIPPSITAQPVNQSVLPGATINLSVTASGSPPLRYQWRLNGVNIPGANAATLTITNAQPADGGSYSVVVANVGGTIISDSILCLISSPFLSFSDDLDASSTITSASGIGSGSNVGATRETGETNHVGKVGGRSVWLNWIAPATGIATFNTRGSSFDTLLAIYTRTTADLAFVAADEDRGGFLTSQASFNAVAGTQYFIAVDGFAGASGNIVLSWNLDTSTVPFPRIIAQPLSQSVQTGQNATFFVTANSLSPIRYQWFVGCRALPGATNTSLTVSNVQAADVGNYHVFVVNTSSKLADSFDAFLEIGPAPKILSHDKLEDLLNSDNGSGGSLAGPLKSGASLLAAGGGFLSVSAGVPGSQILDNTGATTQEGEPIPCGVLGGASKWFGVQPSTDGVFLIDTIGSAIDTVLAIYTGTDLLHLNYIACDNNGAPDGLRSLVRFDVAHGTKYYIAVDGVNGAQGLINLNWRLGTRPTLGSTKTYPIVHQGGSLTFFVTSADSIPPPIYQWRLNGKDIAGATNLSLTLLNLLPTQTGIISVVASNFTGAVTNTVASITVAQPIQLQYDFTTSAGAIRFHLTSSPGTGVIEGSTDLATWTPIRTNLISTAAIDFKETQAVGEPTRFFRVVPWSNP